jgi:L-ascorbate metabolism protein UlaG (beta-lactamase superfamily)
LAPRTIDGAPDTAALGDYAVHPRRTRVTYVGHATVLIELDGVRLLTDPVFRNGVAHLRRHGPAPGPETRARIDAVLLSHLHHDHADLPSLRALSGHTPLLVPRGAGEFLRRAGFSAVSELAVGESATVDGVRIAAVRAVHRGHRTLFGPRADAVGYEVVGSHRLYFAGDTDLFEGMKALAGELDVALLPVWGWGPSLGSGHLDPERGARAAALLAPRVAVPIHWGTFFPLGLARLRPRHLRVPPREFARRTAELAPQVEVRVLSPGESTSLSA